MNIARYQYSPMYLATYISYSDHKMTPRNTSLVVTMPTCSKHIIHLIAKITLKNAIATATSSLYQEVLSIIVFLE